MAMKKHHKKNDEAFIREEIKRNTRGMYVSVGVILLILILSVGSLYGYGMYLKNKPIIPDPAETEIPEITMAPEDTEDSGANTEADQNTETQSNIEEGEKPMVQIEMENGKKIIMELYPQYAHETVDNFVSLVNSGFYNGLTFHRVIKGFMIQGGDPKGDGTGGSEKNIHGEFSKNGFTANTLKHTRGVVSMARSNDMNSASSQFFIMHEDASHLDGGYAAFGKVIEGMDVVDEIAGTKTANEKPETPQVMKSVTIVK